MASSPAVLIYYNISKDSNLPNHVSEVLKEKKQAYVLLKKIKLNPDILNDVVSIIC